jgi:nitrate/TMAO reductase-like tetraheme cytochrome c subunit
MAGTPEESAHAGVFTRTWRGLTSPSARWSVLALVVVGLVIGAGAVIATQVMVTATGTTAFCGGACHSMQWVAQEHKQSAHGINRTGVTAGCADCHIPHSYPQVLWYKAKAGIKDAIGEMRGVIATEEKFKKERLRMAKLVWAEYKETNSANCRTCHTFTADVLTKQKPFVQPMHKQVLDGQATCIDCHKGGAHAAAEMLPSCSCSTRWMCSHSTRRSDIGLTSIVTLARPASCSNALMMSKIDAGFAR